jgi:hypothetical protein
MHDLYQLPIDAATNHGELHERVGLCNPQTILCLSLHMEHEHDYGRTADLIDQQVQDNLCLLAMAS